MSVVSAAISRYFMPRWWEDGENWGRKFPVMLRSKFKETCFFKSVGCKQQLLCSEAMAFFGLTSLGPQNTFSSNLAASMMLTEFTAAEFAAAFAKVDKAGSGGVDFDGVDARDKT